MSGQKGKVHLCPNVSSSNHDTWSMAVVLWQQYEHYLYFNARSILPKMDELKVDPSIVCLVETWLCDAICDFEISIKDFQLVRLGKNRHGGGVLIYVYSSLNWDVLLNGPNDL